MTTNPHDHPESPQPPAPPASDGHRPNESTAPDAPGAPLPPPPAGASVARSAAVMGVATSLSRVAGLAREQVFAFLFGAGDFTDAFNVAYRIPNLLRDLFAEGAMSSAFVPTFNEALTRDGRDEAFRLTNRVLSALLVIVGTITIVGILTSPWLVGLLAGEYRTVPGKFAVTVTMTQIMFPYLLEISWAAIAMGMLNSLGEFFVPAIAPALLNVAMIVAGFTLCPLAAYYGWPAITGMAVGAMLGGILQMTVQFVALWRRGYRPAWCLDFADARVRQIARLMVPGTVGLAATQVNVAVGTVLATSLGTGPVSWLGYAFRLMQLPIGVFGVSVAQANLPMVSRQAAARDLEGFAGTLGSSLRLTMLLTVPASLLLIGLAEPILRLLFQHGCFTTYDTQQTAVALSAYAIGLFAFAAVKVLGPSYYALGDTRTPVRSSLASVGVNLTASLILTPIWGVFGLAFANSLAGIANFAQLWWNLPRHVENPGRLGIGITLLKTAVIGAIAAAALRPLHGGLEAGLLAWGCTSFRGGGILANGLALTAAGIVGLALVLMLGRVAGIAEVTQAVNLIQRRLLRRKQPEQPRQS